MHYGELKKCDIANGIGVRVTLFVSGCTNHCPDCFQPQTWDFDYGKEFTEDTKAEIFAELDKPFVNGLTVLGGEPFEPRNQRELLPLLRSDDLLFITADHGCDPSTPSTDHSREHVPMLAYGAKVKPGVNIGTRSTYADLAATVAEYLGVKAEIAGESFLKEILK